MLAVRGVQWRRHNYAPQPDTKGPTPTLLPSAPYGQETPVGCISMNDAPFPICLKTVMILLTWKCLQYAKASFLWCANMNKLVSMTVPLVRLRVCVWGISKRNSLFFFQSYLQYFCTGSWAAVLDLLFYRAVVPLLLPNCTFHFFPPIRAHATVEDKPAEQSGFMPNEVIDLRFM